MPLVKSIKRLAPYYGILFKHKWPFLGALVSGMIYGVASGAGFPVIAKQVIETVFEGDGPPELFPMILLIPLVVIARSTSQFANVYLTAYCGVRVLEEIRGRVFAKMQALHLGFFTKRSKGDLLSRLLVDCNVLKTTTVDVSNSLIKEPFTLISAVGYIIYLMFKKEQLGLLVIFLLSIPVCVFPIRYFGKKLAKRASRLQAEVGNVTECASENLGALREIRAFNLQGEQNERFGATVRRYTHFQLKVVKYNKILSPSIELITGIILTGGIYYVAVSDMDIEVDEMIALFLALFLAYEPIKGLGQIHNKLRQGLVSLDRIETVLNHPVEIADPVEPRPIPSPLRGRVVFENVSFRYENENVVRSLSCELEAGKTYALVGPSGGGKSTFVNLVLRFYDPVEGRITLDDIDLRDFRVHDLREQISLVSQDPVLFNDTILRNILLSKPDATQEQVEEAARRAHAHEFIVGETEHGYHTIVGDRGTRLSGGQKQRIAIARAFLKNSPILVLDEATSALDSESESKIHDALVTLIKGKTVIMIAHRFSTLTMADEIIVLDRGTLSGKGTHQELIESNAIYQNLYAKQELK